MRAALALGLSALLAVSACGLRTAAPTSPEAAPPPRPAQAGRVRSPADEASSREAERYARIQSDLLSRGLLRTEREAPDTPFSQRDLVADFIRVALYDEYAADGGALIPRETVSRLRRWEKPVRMAPVFGDSVPLAQRKKDRRAIADYVRRLRRLTGLDIAVTDAGDANFPVLILNEAERRAYGPQLRERVPGIGARAVRTITQMPRETFCLVFAFSRGNASTYSRAVAVIRAEHPDLMRLSCFQEELAQGLGLANDSASVRPSIFNDDEEFALLTRHDELLLQMLYDPRMRPGMTPAEARPVAEEIAAELLGPGT